MPGFEPTSKQLNCGLETDTGGRLTKYYVLGRCYFLRTSRLAFKT